MRQGGARCNLFAGDDAVVDQAMDGPPRHNVEALRPETAGVSPLNRSNFLGCAHQPSDSNRDGTTSPSAASPSYVAEGLKNERSGNRMLHEFKRLGGYTDIIFAVFGRRDSLFSNVAKSA
jgi:hypothetical protein